ncbi:MAG: 5,6-dimethylbenzimidazole synthase [Vulcanimicrobiaceae bacterium]
MNEDFSPAERSALYRAIALRRDVRAEFLPDPVADDVLERVLGAAHHAPSVGLSQPWRFIVVRDLGTRRAVHAAFTHANAAAAGTYEAVDAERYRSLRLAGILDAPVNVCVTCDDAPARGNGLGRRTMPETARYSTVCAVQNLWLAARVEGLGVGWVSILEPADLRALLGIPEPLAIVAYLCVGYVTAFAPVADLERDKWEARVALADVVDYERYGGT